MLVDYWQVLDLEKKMEEIKGSMESLTRERDALRIQLEREFRQRAAEDEELRFKLKVSTVSRWQCRDLCWSNMGLKYVLGMFICQDAYLRIKQLEAEKNC